MHLFNCGHCGQRPYFENVSCTRCGATLGFLPERHELVSLDASGDGLWRLHGEESSYRMCVNYAQHAGCNWMIPADDPHEFRPACRIGERVLTGDALLIDGCGRTVSQNGDARALYHSQRHKFFALADDTLVFPGHDYNQRWVSSIAQEKARNPRIGGDRDLEGFVKLMDELDLAYPKFIDYAVPGNRECGVCPPDVAENLEKYCDQIGDSRQG